MNSKRKSPLNKKSLKKKSKMENEDEEIYNSCTSQQKTKMITIKKNDKNMIKTIAISLQFDDDRDIDIL